MPLGEAHIALNFEEPVSMHEIKLVSEKDGEFKVWATCLDDEGNYELREPIFLGQGKGHEVFLPIPSTLSQKRITSLLVARNSDANKIEQVASIDAAKVGHAAGNAYSYALPETDLLSDNADAPFRSNLILLEDGKPLKHPHSIHDDVRNNGRGRYSHWENIILFSTSDNTDPRTNGRQYSLGKDNSSSVKIHIDFNSPAVRL